MPSHDFDRRYRLLKVVAQGDGVRTHNAQELTTGRVVMVHVVDAAGPDQVEALQARLARLAPADKVRVLETATLPSGYAVVTDFLPALRSFPDWLVARLGPGEPPLTFGDPAVSAPAAAAQAGTPSDGGRAAASPTAEIEVRTAPVGSSDDAALEEADLPGAGEPPVAVGFRVGGPTPSAGAGDPPARPGEFTRLFMAGGRVQTEVGSGGVTPAAAPAATTAPTPPPPAPVPPPAPPTPAAPPDAAARAGARDPAGAPGARPWRVHAHVPGADARPPRRCVRLAVRAAHGAGRASARSGRPRPAPRRRAELGRAVHSARPTAGVRGSAVVPPAVVRRALPAPGRRTAASAAPAGRGRRGECYGGDGCATARRRPAGSRPGRLRGVRAAARPACGPGRARAAAARPARLRGSFGGFGGPPNGGSAPPPLFGVPPLAGGPGNVASPFGGAGSAPPSEYTRMIRQAVTPPPPPAAPAAPAPVVLPPVKRAVPLSLLVVGNLVLLAAVALVLYFALRPKPPAPVPAPAVPPAGAPAGGPPAGGAATGGR
jgi:hypothetical protein